jgi:hypothetical protein
VAVPNFGDIAASAHFGYVEAFFYDNPGDQAVSAGASIDRTVATFTMPFTGDIFLDCAVYGYINGTAYQYIILSCPTTSDPDPTTAPDSLWNGGSATNPYPINTVPVKAYWSNVSSGTSVTIKVRFYVGGGSPGGVYRTCFGTYRCCRA